MKHTTWENSPDGKILKSDANIAKNYLDEKDKYIYNTGLENDYYKKIIIKYIEKYGQATKKEIVNLLRDKLPDSLSDKNKVSRVRYLLALLKDEGIIYNAGTKGTSCWKLK